MSTQQVSLGASARLARLSPAQRDAYRSCVMNGLRPEEAAKASDKSASTIRTHLHRARQKLGEEA